MSLYNEFFDQNRDICAMELFEKWVLTQQTAHVIFLQEFNLKHISIELIESIQQKYCIQLPLIDDEIYSRTPDLTIALIRNDVSDSFIVKNSPGSWPKMIALALERSNLDLLGLHRSLGKWRVLNEKTGKREVTAQMDFKNSLFEYARTHDNSIMIGDWNADRRTQENREFLEVIEKTHNDLAVGTKWEDDKTFSSGLTRIDRAYLSKKAKIDFEFKHIDKTLDFTDHKAILLNLSL